MGKAQIQQSTAVSRQLVIMGHIQSTMVTKIEEHKVMIEQMAAALEKPADYTINTPSLPLPLQTDSFRDHSLTTSRRARLPHCTCPISPRQAKQHFSWCNIPRQPRKPEAMWKKLNYRSKWLGISVEALIVIEKTARGFSISPMLRFTATVPQRTGAFALLRRPPKRATWEEVSHFYDDMIRKLQMLFDEGKASPTDIDAVSGSTLMHIVASRHTNPRVCGRHGLRLVQYLERAGCPVTEEGEH
ncbi:hypothetical protein BJX65DRAFT_106287 [Aspergillus insuetus]